MGGTGPGSRELGGNLQGQSLEVPREPSRAAVLTRSKLPDLAQPPPPKINPRCQVLPEELVWLYEPRRAGEKGALGGKLEAMARDAPGWSRSQNPSGLNHANHQTPKLKTRWSLLSRWNLKLCCCHSGGPRTGGTWVTHPPDCVRRLSAPLLLPEDSDSRRLQPCKQGQI